MARSGSIDGAGNSDRLQADNVASTFVVTGSDTGTATGLGAGFIDVEYLKGGGQIDTFQLSGGSISGFIDGGGNSDVLVGDNVANSFVVNGLDMGTATGLGGGFTDVENLTGGVLGDTFELNSGTLSGSIDGDNGIDTLIGDDLLNVFVLTGADAGTVTGLGVGFTGVENLTGGAQGDTFQLNGGTLSGSVDGSGDEDTLIADDIASTFVVTGADTGTATGLGVGFIDVENLTGGSSGDLFQAAAGAMLTGVMDGANGNDHIMIMPDPFVSFRAVGGGNGPGIGDVLTVQGQNALPVNDGLVIATSESATVEHSGFETFSLQCALCAPLPATMAKSVAASRVDRQFADVVFGDWREDEIHREMNLPRHAEIDRAVKLLNDGDAAPVFGDWSEDGSRVEAESPLHADPTRADDLWDDALAVIERDQDSNESTKTLNVLSPNRGREDRSSI